ncbi:LOW QUALITY PROTEIN: hypothetical protein MXB_5086, partial [Myxobolus squamalis]
LNGFLTITKSFFWIPIQQNINQLVSLRVYSHILSLNFDWHLHAKNSELMKIIERSGRSVDHIIKFHLCDIQRTATSYRPHRIICTYIFNKWKEQLRNSMKACEENSMSIVMDTLMNFSTVKNFLNENLEQNRYKSSLDILQVDKILYNTNEKSALQKLLLLNFSQNVIVIIGLAMGCIICLKDCSKSST